jgi:hypothetical protein
MVFAMCRFFVIPAQILTIARLRVSVHRHGLVMAFVIIVVTMQRVITMMAIVLLP